MPTKKEREYYRMGFYDGSRGIRPGGMAESYLGDFDIMEIGSQNSRKFTSKPKRKLSAWNKFVKANSKKPRFRYARSNKINLKKMAIAFRKKRR